MFYNAFPRKKTLQGHGVSNKLIFIPSEFPRLNTLLRKIQTHTKCTQKRELETERRKTRNRSRKTQNFPESRNRAIFPPKGRSRWKIR